MLKRVLFVAVSLALCSSSGYAQQVFVTFGEGAQPAVGARVDLSEETGSAFIYSAGDFQFDAFDLDFSIADDSVIRFTNVELFNPVIGDGIITFGTRWETQQRALLTDTTGDLLALSLSQIGVDPGLAGTGFDEYFDPAVANPDGRPGGSFLLARVDYDIVAVGTVDLELEVGDNLFLSLNTPQDLISPTLGNATLVVGVPEPSTAGILALGLVGLVARRRR